MKLILSLIIVNYNTRELILDCLRSIEEFLLKEGIEVIVVDNGSSDGSLEAIRANFEWAKVIANRENEGFGKANNRGAKQASGDFLLFLNSDTLLTDERLAEIVDFMRVNTKVGVAEPRLMLADRKTEQLGVYGLEPSLFRLVTRQSKPKLRWQGERDKKYALVDWVTGAAMFIRKEVFREIGGFDSRFFMYFEDVDLCRQVREKGYKVAFCPISTIVHFGGQSLEDGRKKTVYYQSQEIYFEKYGKKVWLMKLLRAPIRAINYVRLHGWRQR